jgi:chemotaxis regulatin CheY-phosphate phosphatase CheZ
MSQNEQGGSAQLSEEAAEDLIFRIGKLTRKQLHAHVVHPGSLIDQLA